MRWDYLAIVMISAASMGLPSASAAEVMKPNILLIVSDDQGWADVGFQGSQEAVTPHLDALARAGVRCTNGYASHCYCSPSRAGLLTGRYQARFGYEYNPTYAPDNDRLGVPFSERLLPQYLKQAEYRTGWVGKWHLGASPKHLPWNRGFDETFGFIGGGHQYRDWKPDGREYFIPLVRNGKEIPDIPAHLTTTLGEEAAAFVQRNQGHPWLLYLAFNAPHAPHQPSAEAEAQFADITNPGRRKNLAQISLMDDAIGAVTAALNETGQTKGTLVFFIGDNGGQPTFSADNTPLRAGKGTLYEGGVRAPFVVSWPGTLPEGTTYDEPVIALDAFATALDVAGVAAPKDVKFDGVDLLPYLAGKVKTPPHQRLFWRTRQKGQLFHAVREGRWKVVRPEGQSAELYDLQADLGESKNLADEKPEILNDLTAALDAWDKELAPSATTGRAPRSR
ncbi:MAG: sulfatase-like hydrolase/transferase [Isosphaeraceae bacterium]